MTLRRGGLYKAKYNVRGYSCSIPCGSIVMFLGAYIPKPSEAIQLRSNGSSFTEVWILNAEKVDLILLSIDLEKWWDVSFEKVGNDK